MATPTIQYFYQESSGTLSYVVSDPDTNQAVVIDAAADFDIHSGRLSFRSAQAILDYINENQLNVEWILESHAHADHITAAAFMKRHTGAKIGTGKGITKVQATFKSLYNLHDDFCTQGQQFDHLFEDGESFHFGQCQVSVMATPGHTNDGSTYIIGDQAFIGDTLFAPDSGTARCDFPGGDAGRLWDSIQKILALGDNMTLWLCHDYCPEHRALLSHVTVTQQKANIHLQENNNGVVSDRTREEFVALRTKRDRQLAVPKLLYPSIQININAGEPPVVEGENQSFLKIPLTISAA